MSAHHGEGTTSPSAPTLGHLPPRLMTIDLDRAVVELQTEEGFQTVAFSSPQAFDLVSKVWLRVGWDTKHVYSFTWMGRPVIQLPEDLVRIQEVVYRIRPDVIIETGIAHGGGLVYYASLCKAMGKGRVIGVDREIRPHNRMEIEAHELFEYITLIEGNSVDPAVVAQVASLVKPGETVLVTLDSDHTKAHVLAELEAYAPLVSVGSYIIAADGIMAELAGAPRTTPDWAWNNPRAAAAEFAQNSDDFVLDTPSPVFNEGVTTGTVSYWSGGWLRRLR